MTGQEDVSMARGVGSALLAGLTLFTYIVLRLIEARQAHFVRQQGELGIDVENDRDAMSQVEKEDAINFEEIEEAFFQMEKAKRPTLNLRDNLRIFVQALATVAFSCHTSATLPIALIGIIFSSGLVFFCVWRRQLRYSWMSRLAAFHLRGTLFFVICATTTAATMLVATWEDDEIVLDGLSDVLRIVGGFSAVLGTMLFVVWAQKTRRAFLRRKLESRIHQELL